MLNVILVHKVLRLPLVYTFVSFKIGYLKLAIELLPGGVP